jgi:hypothetical protein
MTIFTVAFLTMLSSGTKSTPVPFAGLTFHALGGMSDRSITIRIANQYKAPLDEFLNRPEDGLSDVAFENLKTGTYLIKFAAPGMLIKQISVTLEPGKTNHFGNIDTWLGDINGDNVIDTKDTSILKRYLGAASGSDLWRIGDFEDDYSGSDCDLNNDNVVDSVDLAIATANLGKVGD